MTDYSKLTKAQLIIQLQEKDGIIVEKDGLIVTIAEEIEDNKFNNFKEAFGLPYHTDEEWIDFFNLTSKELNNYKKDIRKRELNKCI